MQPNADDKYEGVAGRLLKCACRQWMNDNRYRVTTVARHEYIELMVNSLANVCRLLHSITKLKVIIIIIIIISVYLSS